MTRATGSKRSAEEEGAAAAAGYHGQHAHSYGAHSPLVVTSSSAAAVGSTAGLPTTAAIASSCTAAAAASNASSATVGYRPMVAAAAAAYPVPNGKSEMVPRTQSATVSEEVWAKAIHAVKIQKMSLRQAAQLYGVHHMSLHRRVRGRYASPLPPSADIRAFLSPDDEAEALGVLREQFLHEKRITTDDIRFVVRAIASQGGKQSIPAEFPPSRWIHDFKRAHGFVKLNNYAYPMASSTSQQGDDDVGADEDDSMSNYSEYLLGSSTRSSHGARGHRASAAAESHSAAAQQNGRRSGTGSVESNYEAADREDYNSSTPNGNSLYDTGLTTGSSSGGSYENGESEKRTYRLSHTVPPETWEKAIAAVEQQGMSLRSAAKMYGVHFAALHRRVKKRAQGEQATGIEGYFQPDDEAGIIRVVVARAELGVLMNFDELMDLAQRAALRNLPDLSVEAARKLMTRFQSRNEHSIRHIIADWPSPHSNPHTAIPRVVNNPDQLQRSSSAPSVLRGPAFSGARPPSPRAARSYAAARNSEQPLGRIQSLPDQQQQQQSNGDLVHSPLPPLHSEFPPPPPASSIFSRHTPSPLAARRVPQPVSSAAAAASDHDTRYGNHDDRAPRRGDHHHPYDSNSSYDDDDDRNRRDSGSSEGDAVMFV